MTSSTRIAILLCVFSSSVFAQGNCVETAKVVQPQVSAEAQRDLETKLNEARALFEKEQSADNLIWLGRRTAYLGRYKDAIRIYSDGIKKFPALQADPDL